MLFALGRETRAAKRLAPGPLDAGEMRPQPNCIMIRSPGLGIRSSGINVYRG